MIGYRKSYRSAALRSLHEVAEDLHAVGGIEKATMRRFDLSCLTPVEAKGARDRKKAATGKCGGRSPMSSVTPRWSPWPGSARPRRRQWQAVRGRRRGENDRLSRPRTRFCAHNLKADCDDPI
jgi:hypothetical protein